MIGRAPLAFILCWRESSRESRKLPLVSGGIQANLDASERYRLARAKSKVKSKALCSSTAPVADEEVEELSTGFDVPRILSADLGPQP